MLKKYILLSIGLVLSWSFYAQILITDADLDAASPLGCAANSGTDPNFFDSGNTSASYTANENETIVICPDYAGGTSKLSLNFGNAAGLSFDVHASDTLYVYDGPNTSAPLLGKHNSDTDPGGFSHISSFANNPTGCFTIQFVSDGADEGTGWEANISCSQELQPIEPHMEGLLYGLGADIIDPSDTGYIDICFGDSILFLAKSIFPYSLENTGHGYSQDPNSSITYTWETSDGLEVVGDSLWFKPSSRNGFIIRLTTSDSRSQTKAIQAKVRVSTVPGFSGVLITRDDICVGDTTVVIGAVTSSDTSGVDPTTTSFQAGGVFSDTTFLPDGFNAIYTTQITIAGYDPGSTITRASDIQELYASLEHTWLGDLEMTLTCPNGIQTTIFDAYDGPGGLINGGFNGSSTNLGDANDDGTIAQGIGWTYRWSTVNASLGDFETEIGNGNTIFGTVFPQESLDTNGIYLPEESFANFIGCPVNGNWTITVKDNQSIDNGYIFEWGIEFDTVFNVTSEFYAPQILSSQWLSAASILPGSPSDTFIVVTSNDPGLQNYTFEVTDDFGCIYDTTVQVNFVPQPAISITGDGAACNQYQVTGTTSFSGGVWSFTGPGNALFTPSANDENPLVQVDVRGLYTLTYTDSRCGSDTSINILFAETPSITPMIDTTICIGEEGILAPNLNVADATYLWSTGETSPSITVTDSGKYYVNVVNTCSSASDTVLVTTEDCLLVTPNIVTPNGDGMNDYLIVGGLQKYPGTVLKVFNRWGVSVYESNDYQNDWSPTKLEAGTYFYILNPGGVIEADVETKTFTLLK